MLNHSLIWLRQYAPQLPNAGCRDVVTEPLLLPTAGSNTANNARADVSARSIWNPLKRAFSDRNKKHL